MTAAVQRSKGRGPKYLHDEDCQWAMAASTRKYYHREWYCEPCDKTMMMQGKWAHWAINVHMVGTDEAVKGTVRGRSNKYLTEEDRNREYTADRYRFNHKELYGESCDKTMLMHCKWYHCFYVSICATLKHSLILQHLVLIRP